MSRQKNRIPTLRAWTLLLALGLLPPAPPAAAENQGLTVIPGGKVDNFADVVTDHYVAQNRNQTGSIRAVFTCFRTNLRSVPAPLSPSSKLKMRVTYTTAAGSPETIEVLLPSTLTLYGFNGTANVEVLSPRPVRTTASGNLVRIDIPNFNIQNATVDNAGNVDIEQRMGAFKSAEFFQVVDQQVLQNDQVIIMPFDRPVNSVVTARASDNNKVYEIHAAFPGAAGFCGGYYSPLMLFFDDKRPSFSGESSFPIHPNGGKTHWVEPGAPGSFLAYDRDGDGRITELRELFGSQVDGVSGFDALKEFDSNGDGKVNAADAKFKKLLLWQDADGDGASTEKELGSLASRGVTEIRLKNELIVQRYGTRAEARERGVFVFKQKGKEATGEVIDMWFAPVGAQ